MKAAPESQPAIPKTATRAPGWWWWKPRFPDHLYPSRAQAARQSHEALNLRDQFMEAKA